MLLRDWLCFQTDALRRDGAVIVERLAAPEVMAAYAR